MSRLGDICAGFMARLEDGGLTFNHEDGLLMTPPTPPCFEVDFPDDAYVYGPTFSRGVDTLEVILRGIVQVGDANNAQETLYEWVDPSGSDSVATILNAERTLGGKVDDLFVVSVTAPRRVVDPSKPNALLLSAEWRVRLSLTP